MARKPVGRPATKTGSAAAKKRAQERKRYNSLPLSERKAIVQNRDKDAQRKADAKRYRSQKSSRDEYHKEQARAVKGVKAGGKCSRCGSTENVERHHMGGKVVKLCATCHAKARKGR